MALSARPARAEAGFTLISVMVALAMLAIGLIAIARSQAIVLREGTASEARSTALAIATARLEDLRSRNPWTLAGEAPTRVDSEGRPSGTGAYTRQVEVTELQANLLRVRVSVTPARLPQPVVLETYLYRGATT